MKMMVLCACEESQVVTTEFRKLGHEAYSCDTEPCSGEHQEWHLQRDVTPLLKENWDIIIAHPPCTYMSKAGARWMFGGGKINEERLRLAKDAKEFFMLFYNNKCKRICIENPTPLKIVELPKETQIVQPYQFGNPYSKRTLLWLKGLPNLIPTNILSEFKPWMPSNTSRFSKGFGGSNGVAHDKQTSSRTFVGIAKAMADQWGRETFEYPPKQLSFFNDEQ